MVPENMFSLSSTAVAPHPCTHHAGTHITTCCTTHFNHAPTLLLVALLTLLHASKVIMQVPTLLDAVQRTFQHGRLRTVLHTNPVNPVNPANPAKKLCEGTHFTTRCTNPANPVNNLCAVSGAVRGGGANLYPKP